MPSRTFTLDEIAELEGETLGQVKAWLAKGYFVEEAPGRVRYADRTAQAAVEDALNAREQSRAGGRDDAGR